MGIVFRNNIIPVHTMASYVGVLDWRATAVGRRRRRTPSGGSISENGHPLYTSR